MGFYKTLAIGAALAASTQARRQLDATLQEDYMMAQLDAFDPTEPSEHELLLAEIALDLQHLDDAQLDRLDNLIVA